MNRSDPNRSVDDLPPAMSSLLRTLKFGYRAEPKLLLASFAAVVLGALPDVLVALWLKVLSDGVLGHHRTQIIVGGVGLGVSATGTWLVRIVSERTERRFRDRVGIALEAHVAELHARVATIEHQERPAYMDRLSVLRDQVFALDHLFLSLFSTLGWLVRLVLVIALLASIHPALLLLVLFAIPTVYAATNRPAVERAVEEGVAPRMRLARHLFVLGTSATPAKEVRVSGTDERLVAQRREAADDWFAEVSAARWATALWQALGWTIFGLGYVGAIVFIASGLDASVGSVLLVLVAGSRLSGYIGAAVGELGFLRGIWLDSSQRMCWLEDFAAAHEAHTDQPVPSALHDGVRFDRVSFAYPGTSRLVLDNVTATLPRGAVIAIVGENGAGKTTLVKLLAKMYEPSSGAIHVDDTPLARVPAADWRARMAGAFQDFFRFEFRAQQTVGLGDVRHIDERDAVTTAVGRAGADDVIAQLPKGLDTQLGKTWPEGAELSFGQWQKLALARGFMRDGPLLLVLDEPTAALDAETEHALFERYAAAARGDGGDGGDDGRITLLVSHRFSTVRMADLILVMDGARLIESGAHDELMAKGGQYAQLYGIQAAAYR